MFRLIAILILSVLCLVSGDDSPQDRVVNGNRADIINFPYQVSLQEGGRHFCGGSILNEKWILTAAHCIFEPMMENRVNSIMVRAGTSTYPSGGTLKSVESGKIHENYNPRNMEYDAALLKLVGPLIYSASIKPVSILTSPLPSGRSVTVSGWGQLSDRNTNLPINLQAVDMAYLTLQECAKWHGPAVMDSMVCAIGPGIDACRGDSGGPLCVTGTSTQVGIVSWGINCADAGLPGAYTDLTNVAIRSFLERNVGRLV